MRLDLAKCCNFGLFCGFWPHFGWNFKMPYISVYLRSEMTWPGKIMSKKGLFKQIWDTGHSFVFARSRHWHLFLKQLSSIRLKHRVKWKQMSQIKNRLFGLTEKFSLLNQNATCYTWDLSCLLQAYMPASWWSPCLALSTKIGERFATKNSWLDKNLKQKVTKQKGNEVTLTAHPPGPKQWVALG